MIDRRKDIHLLPMITVNGIDYRYCAEWRIDQTELDTVIVYNGNKILAVIDYNSDFETCSYDYYDDDEQCYVDHSGNLSSLYHEYLDKPAEIAEWLVCTHPES